MGAWDSGPFGNDDALDWLPELGAEGLPAAGAALADVLELAGTEYLEAPIGSRGIAAAEVVAAARGCPGPELPVPVPAVLARPRSDPGPELAALAARAVDAVAAPGSELAELWGEDPDWRAAVADLRARLAQAEGSAGAA